MPLLEKSLENPRRIREKDTLEVFLHYDLTNEFCHLGEVRDAIDEFKVVKSFGKYDYIDKIICFVYANIMNPRQTEKNLGNNSIRIIRWQCKGAVVQQNAHTPFS